MFFRFDPICVEESDHADIPRFLFCILDFLIGGSIGFIASYFALRRLYSSIRVD